MNTLVSNNILMEIPYSVIGTFKYYVLGPMVPNTTSLKYYRNTKHILDWPIFSELDKYDFFK